MESNCPCKYKCGAAEVILSESSVIKKQPFKVKIKPYRKELDVSSNTMRKVIYKPNHPFKISASDGIGFECNQNYDWQEHYTINEEGESIFEYYYAEVSGCYFTEGPPDGKDSVNLTISVQDSTPPCEGACGAASIILKNADDMPATCSFSKTETSTVSSAMTDFTGDIYDTCEEWWTDEETGEEYCMYYGYTRSNLPEYARWCNYGDWENPYNQFFGFSTAPSGGTPKEGTVTCTINGNVSVENASEGTYQFYLRVAASTGIADNGYPDTNTWGVKSNVSLSLPEMPDSVEGANNSFDLSTSPCGDDHGMVWVNGILRGIAWHYWFVPNCSDGDECYQTCMDAQDDIDTVNNQTVTEEEISGIFGGFQLATGSWDGACCGYCTGGGFSAHLQRGGLDIDDARALCAMWTKTDAITIGINNG